MSRNWGRGGMRIQHQKKGKERGMRMRVQKRKYVCVLVGIIITAPPQSSFIDARIRVSCLDLSSFDKH